MHPKSSESQPSQPNPKEPIAIIGIGCRFPGGVNNPETFWQLLVNEVDAISDIPADRVDVAPYYDQVPAAPGKIASSQGGFLDRVDQFDASFFGVSPREANLWILNNACSWKQPGRHWRMQVNCLRISNRVKPAFSLVCG